jgi:hypothetical protein
VKVLLSRGQQRVRDGRAEPALGVVVLRDDDPAAVTRVLASGLTEVARRTRPAPAPGTTWKSPAARPGKPAILQVARSASCLAATVPAGRPP